MSAGRPLGGVRALRAGAVSRRIAPAPTATAVRDLLVLYVAGVLVAEVIGAVHKLRATVDGDVDGLLGRAPIAAGAASPVVDT
jgi:hypothetical protein